MKEEDLTIICGEIYHLEQELKKIREGIDEQTEILAQIRDTLTDWEDY